jgi:hypothetical protein
VQFGIMNALCTGSISPSWHVEMHGLQRRAAQALACFQSCQSMHGRMTMAASESLHAISAHHVRDEYPHLMRAVLRPNSVLQREHARVLTPPAHALSLYVVPDVVV